MNEFNRLSCNAFTITSYKDLSTLQLTAVAKQIIQSTEPVTYKILDKMQYAVEFIGSTKSTKRYSFIFSNLRLLPI